MNNDARQPHAEPVLHPSPQPYEVSVLPDQRHFRELLFRRDRLDRSVGLYLDQFRRNRNPSEGDQALNLDIAAFDFHFRGARFRLFFPRLSTIFELCCEASRHIGAPVDAFDFYYLSHKICRFETPLTHVDFAIAHHEPDPILWKTVDVIFRQELSAFIVPSFVRPHTQHPRYPPPPYQE